MKKIIMSAVIFLLIGGIAFSANRYTDRCIAFLNSYGWEVSKQPIETAEFTLPEALDAVYENYNELQRQAGLDLIPYLGKSGTRYTYRVINYPNPVDAEVRANVLVISGEPVAGDICTVNLNGFMHSLLMPK